MNASSVLGNHFDRECRPYGGFEAAHASEATENSRSVMMGRGDA